MTKISSVKRITVTAVCVALCCVLPMAFHAVGLGTTFSPIHIPSLLCGLICGPVYGALCGFVGPLLASVITGMPGPAVLPSMVPELMAYGLVAGLLMRFVRTGKTTADLYISLGAAMVLGRVVGGAAKALVYMGNGEAFTLAVWVSGYFVATLPGIVCHLILIPVLYYTLVRAKLIPGRYGKAVAQ